MTKYFFILEILIKEGLAAYKTQIQTKQEAKNHKVGKFFDHTLYKCFFKKYTANDWCSSKVKLTPTHYFLETYLQHSKQSYFSDIYTECNDSHFLVHQMAWDTFDHLCKKAQKSVKKLERKYCNNNLCIIDAVQICNSSIHHFKYFLGNLSWNFGIRVWKKAWFDTPT